MNKDNASSFFFFFACLVNRLGQPIKSVRKFSTSGSRWPSLFERILAFEEGVGAHSEPLAFVWVYTTGNFTKFYDLEEFPYDFPETLHASLYWLVMKKCRRQLFPNWTVCGDRGEKHLFWTPKIRNFWGKSMISSERLVLATWVRSALL